MKIFPLLLATNRSKPCQKFPPKKTCVYKPIMVERSASLESGMKLLRTIIVWGTAAVTAGISGELRNLLGQDQRPNEPQKVLVKEEKPAPLKAKRCAKLIWDLGNEDFITREMAFDELSLHTDERETMLSLFHAIDREEEANENNKDPKKKLMPMNLELLKRAREISDPVVNREIEKYRIRKDVKSHPWMGQLPLDAKLPPRLKKKIGKNRGDTRYFYLQLPEVISTKDPNDKDYDHTHAAEIFTRDFEVSGHRDAQEVTVEDYPKVMRTWAQELERIRIP